MASLTESQMAGTTEGTTEALNAKLTSILQGQEKLRNEIAANFVQQSQQLATLIDQKLAGLRAEIDDKLTTVYNDIRDVQGRVRSLEERGIAVAADGAGSCTHANDVSNLQQRLDALETDKTDRSLSLIVKGLEETINETANDLLLKCQQL